jgi:hypothetical protein
LGFYDTKQFVFLQKIGFKKVFLTYLLKKFFLVIKIIKTFFISSDKTCLVKKSLLDAVTDLYIDKLNANYLD